MKSPLFTCPTNCATISIITVGHYDQNESYTEGVPVQHSLAIVGYSIVSGFHSLTDRYILPSSTKASNISFTALPQETSCLRSSPKADIELNTLLGDRGRD